MSLEKRVEILEKEVEALRTAIGLMVVSSGPAVAWLDNVFLRIKVEADSADIEGDSDESEQK